MPPLAAAAFACALFCGGVVLVSQRARAAQLRRLHILVAAERPAAPAASGRRPDAVLPAPLLHDLAKFGFEPSARDILLAGGALAMLAAVTALLFGPAAAAVASAGAILTGWAVLNILASRRASQLAATLPGFFDRVRQLLSVGNSLPVAFARAAESSPPMLAKFLAPILRRIVNGANFSDSIRQSADTIGLYEMHLFAAAVAANARFGGALTHALGNLVQFLRKRAAIERELRANTAQIRASAWVLALLPLLVASLILVQNPEYGAWFTGNSLGRRLAVYCIASQCIGAALMKMITRLQF